MNNIKNETTLDKLQIGKDAHIVSIDCEDKALRQIFLIWGLRLELRLRL